MSKDTLNGYRRDLRATITTALTQTGTVVSIDEYCCGSCATHALESRLEGGTAYVHANEQTWERVAPGESLWLSHGVAGELDVEATERAARKAVDALVAHGLDASWSGDIGINIEVRL